MTSKKQLNKNVLIIGGGPAGATAAILLSQGGLDVTLVDAKKRSSISLLKIGECLPPDAKGLLQKLELWDAFSEADHLKTYSNKSVWGNDQIHYTDFISHPQGHGWHINRMAFESMLLQKAKAQGADVLEATNIQEVSLREKNWQVRIKTAQNEIVRTEFDFIIDASGRNAWLARRQGVLRHFEDRQLALVAFLNKEKGEKDASSLVETTPNGWWYSAQIPGSFWATAFICKPDQKERADWKSRAGWWELLKTAPHTFERMRAEDTHLVEPPRFVAADSSILDQMYGDKWLAIGDAAMSFDPIASHGIMMAMLSARDASEVLLSYMNGQENLLSDYQNLMQKTFQFYSKKRKEFYHAEKRFSKQAYWNRSQTVSEAL